MQQKWHGFMPQCTELPLRGEKVLLYSFTLSFNFFLNLIFVQTSHDLSERLKLLQLTCKYEYYKIDTSLPKCSRLAMIKQAMWRYHLAAHSTKYKASNLESLKGNNKRKHHSTPDQNPGSCFSFFLIVLLLDVWPFWPPLALSQLWFLYKSVTDLSHTLNWIWSI